MTRRRLGTGVAAAIFCACLAPAPAAGLPPRLAELMMQAETEQYNLTFDRAFVTFERMCREFPDHPAGYAMHGAAIWWQARYWYRTPDEASEKLMETKLSRAIDLAEAMTRDPATRCEGWFFLGGSLGVRAHWKLLTGHLLSAVLSARSAVKVLKPLSECPDYGEEAWFGLGLYEYSASRLPWHKRWISRFLIGGGADRERAFRKLERAATRARFIRHDAQFTLTMFLTMLDLDAGRALKHARTFVAERPDSPVSHALHIQALCYAGKFAAALEEADRSVAAAADEGSPFRRDELAYRYYRGVALLGLRRAPEAIAEFSRAIELEGPPAWMTGSRLMRGCAHDLAGARAPALADYIQARTMQDPWEQVRRAEPFLERPCTWDDFDREFPPPAPAFRRRPEASVSR